MEVPPVNKAQSARLEFVLHGASLAKHPAKVSVSTSRRLLNIVGPVEMPAQQDNSVRMAHASGIAPKGRRIAVELVSKRKLTTSTVELVTKPAPRTELVEWESVCARLEKLNAPPNVSTCRRITRTVEPVVMPVPMGDLAKGVSANVQLERLDVGKNVSTCKQIRSIVGLAEIPVAKKFPARKEYASV